MHQVAVTRRVTDAELDELRHPRDDLVAEESLGPDHFGLLDGPFSAWERTLHVVDGSGEVRETVRFRLDIPVFAFVFTPLVKREIRRGTRRGSGRSAWWAPPERLTGRSGRVLGLLAVISIVTGYLGTLLSQTNTFFKEDFGASDGQIGVTLAVVRTGALVALVIVALADRRGRRRVLLVAAIAGCAATALGALAPDLVWLGASQTVARAFSISMAVIISIVAVEETPAGARAYAVSVLTMVGALGAGQAVLLLWVADLHEGAWRVLYLVPLAAVPVIVWVGRRLPETRRYEHASTEVERARRPRIQKGRLLLLAMSGLCFAVFVAPAAAFQNEYLRTDRGYSAGALIAFNILTNTPGGIGIIVGGKLADARGRRVIGAIGVSAGVGFTVLMYLADGWSIWLWSVLGAMIGALAIPALAVYGPELFPTESRGRANGIINLFGVVGSTIGLAAAGLLADRLAGGLGQAMAVLAIGPVIVVCLVLFLYPETASVELEQLNPEDAPLSRELLGLDGLDPDVLPERYPPRIQLRDPDR